MGQATAIGWTDHTFNGWWGCTKIAAPNGERSACDHCYAEAFAKRTGNDVWGKDGERRFFGDKHWAEPVKWNRAAEDEGRRHRVFCSSMADVFEDRRDLDVHRARLFEVIEATPWLDWQLLTKRPEQMVRLAPSHWAAGWPVNVWAGTTVENQRTADLRVPRLLAVPASVRFLSCEPLLGEVHLTRWLWTVELGQAPKASGAIHWVIVGGESGGGFQPLNLRHARILKHECETAGVAYFFKQVGGRTPKAGGDLLDGVEWKQFPRTTH